MSSILRLLATVATIVAVCFASAQLAGRVAFSQLDRFESLVNAMLRSSGIEVTGVEGRWRGLNPGVFVEQVRFPAGTARGFDFELDVLESLGRNRLVARRLTVADGLLTVDKTANGWQLRGSSGGGGATLQALMVHSDEIWIRGQLVFRSAHRTGKLHVESMHVNQSGRHRFLTHVQPNLRCSECALVVEGDVAAAGPAIATASAEHFALGDDLDAILLAGVSPRSPFSKAHFAATMQGVWRRDIDGSERARLDVALHASGTPGEPGMLAAELSALKGADATRYQGKIERLTLAGGKRAVELADGRFQLGGFDAGAPFADVHLPALSVADLAGVAVGIYGTRHQTGLWLANVAPAGAIEDLVLRLDRRGLAFAGVGANGGLAGHKGVPQTQGLAFSLGGHQRAMRLVLDARDFEVAFPDYIQARGPYDRGGGTLLFTRRPGYVGILGEQLWAEQGGSRAETRLAIARPDDPLEMRVATDSTVDRVDVATARGYVPLGLAPNVRKWLLEAVDGGELRDGRIVFRGHVSERAGLPLRRTEMAASMANVDVDYSPDWPPASRVAGTVEVARSETRVHGTARAFDVDLADVAVRVPRDPGPLDLELRCNTTVERLFAFARNTPVRDAMPFLSDAWQGTGVVTLGAALAVPFRGGELRPGDVRLNLHFRDAVFDFADLDLRFEAIDKRVTFQNPAGLEGEAVHGELFGAPVDIVIASDPQVVRFSVAGTAAAADAVRLLRIDDLGIASGSFDFNATFTVFPVSGRAMEVQVESALEGLGMALPAPLGKAPQESRDFLASLQFLDSHVAISASYGASSGWLHVGDEGIRSGAVGIGAPIPMVDAQLGRLVLGGGVDEIDSETVAALLDGLDSDALAWELLRFRVGQLGFDRAQFRDVLLEGYAEHGERHLTIDSPDLAGTLSRQGEAPWQLDLQTLALPAPEDAEADPLAPALIDRLVAADVQLRQVTVGEDDYGSWRFGVRPRTDGVAFIDLVADVRGLHIESGGGGADGHAFWGKDGETRFEGRVTAGNLQHVLPLWDFAESVVSERFESTGSLRWPGSPLNFDLAHLSGTAALDVANGSFLDVASGGARIMSLINFSTIVKRMSLDFSDVFGQGVAFDRVLADLALDDGMARFATPAQVKGTGSSFLITGTVDLDAGHLNNEMVVTLPFLNSNLPWYAAFLAFSNPAGAAGVWLGREVFKEQIARLSSGKYRIGGTIEAPEVELVSIFDNDIDIALPPTPADELGANVGEAML